MIGAGPSGLAAAKNLLAQGIACEVLEAHDTLGGIWNRSNPRSSVYATTHTITSKPVTAYPGFPLADELPPYPRHDEILSYLESFAAAHQLTDCIRFGQDVVGVRPEEDSSWRIETADGSTRHYRGVIIANGHNWSPRYPTYPG
ncbi:MAG TPA: NAD(P)-binding domain-containing protein, partial [Nakamurella sp.]|nr:NAD(P)-binding domain-containing protein [Nakamurella sp.]